MIRNTEEFVSGLQAARRAATPLIAVRTADPASTIGLAQRSLNGAAETTPLVCWDVVAGLVALNAAGKSMIDSITGDASVGSALGPANVLELAGRMTDDAILFYANPQRVWHQAEVVQGIWNLRDTLKSVGAALVMITPPGVNLPPELVQDVLVLDEPLPSKEVLWEIVCNTFEQAQLEPPSEQDQRRAVDALLGLAAFPAEQVLAMSLSKRGLDHDQLWKRKRQVIEQAPGLILSRPLVYLVTTRIENESGTIFPPYPATPALGGPLGGRKSAAISRIRFVLLSHTICLALSFVCTVCFTAKLVGLVSLIMVSVPSICAL
jgi:hypothetical protein